MTIQVQVPRFIPRDYDVFAGLDVDKRSMAVVFADHDGSQRALRMASSATPLLNYVRKHYAGQRVAFAYEAGPTGYVLYWQLTQLGVECQVIAPQSVLASQPPCPIPFTGLWISAETPPRVNWDHVTCAVFHDVIRGELPGPTPVGSLIDLGRVTCLANDIPQAAWWYVSGPVDPDFPPPGTSYFYLARALGLPDGDATYGHSSDGLEEVPLSGDCPP